jgi:hypothetical protein
MIRGLPCKIITILIHLKHIYNIFVEISLPLGLHLVVVRGFACFNETVSYVGWSYYSWSVQSNVVQILFYMFYLLVMYSLWFFVYCSYYSLLRYLLSQNDLYCVGATLSTISSFPERSFFTVAMFVCWSVRYILICYTCISWFIGSVNTFVFTTNNSHI